MNEQKRSSGIKTGRQGDIESAAVQRIFKRIRISEEEGKSHRRGNISALHPFRNGIRLFSIAGNHGSKRNGHGCRIPRQMSR